MDILLIFISFFLVLIGIIGSFLPVIPGPITGWLGLLVVYQTSFMDWDYYFLGITLVISISVFILDYFIPILGAKKFGGTKAGIIGSTIGLLIGLFTLGPIGILIGTFGGAFIGEISSNPNDNRTAFRAAIGSLVGFLGGVFLKFAVAMTFAIYYLKIIIENWSEIL
tara:strand:- start:60 stop:560 length:501 start_codon:yes stop_codon:yes gene_type:complete